MKIGNGYLESRAQGLNEEKKADFACSSHPLIIHFIWGKNITSERGGVKNFIYTPGIKTNNFVYCAG